MKNLFTNLGAFCLGLLSCVAVIACANDTDDNTGNSIEVLSRQIAELAGRITLVEKNLQQSTSPKVLSVEESTSETGSGIDYFVKCVADYEFDEEGRIIKITERSTGGKESWTLVSNVTYDENKCTIENSTFGEYTKTTTTEKMVFTFDDDDISNIDAVNNLIVSVFTER